MPTKPDQMTLNAHKNMKSNPDFAKQMLKTIINETPELREPLLARGLITVKED